MRTALSVFAFSLLPAAAHAQDDGLWNPLESLLSPDGGGVAAPGPDAEFEPEAPLALGMAAPRSKFGFASVTVLRRITQII